jgi:hypothetical protein
MTPPIPRRLLTVGAWGLFVPAAFACGLVVLRILSTDVNHIGFNVLWLEAPLLMSVPLTWMLGAQTKSRVYWGLCIGSLLLSFLVWLTYRYNVLIPYETWIRRGMPGRGF